jgi:tetratricopeptide (TPR) repeat protein
MIKQNITMMALKKIILSLVFVSACLAGIGQTTLFKTMYPPFDQKTHREAEKQWKEGNLAEAERLYRKAFDNSNNVGHLMRLYERKWEIGDVKGFNQAIDLVIQYNKERLVKNSSAVYKIPLNQAFYIKIDNNLKKGDPRVAIEAILDMTSSFGEKVDNSEKSFFGSAYYEGCETAFLLDDKVSLEKLNQAAKAVKNGEYGELVSSIYLGLMNKQYDSVLTRLLDVTENGGGFAFSKLTAKAMLPIVYTYKGEYDKALEWIEKAKKSILIGDGLFQELYGMIALNKQNYPEAIDKFTTALKGRVFLFARAEPINKYKLYYYRGLAYQGSGDLLKAKKDFESALVYNASYQPAINSMASLEGKIISNRTTDKTPPQISILEPTTVTRGLKVTTAAKDVMVKGIATDASGIQAVTINGTKVYSNEKGDFWGSVPVNEGANKLSVIATDLAGNSAETVFEIEKKTAVAETVADIIPVKEKEGRNFAVLIASQNYADPAIPSLENPIADAVKLKLALKNNYNFQEENIFTLYNPDRAEFRKKLLQVSETLEPEDNLIIFYAGHGIWIDKEKKGYWLLTDAQRKDVNTWLPNKEVLDMIADVSSRHTLLITDACFSGSVFKTRGLGAEAPPAMREMSEKISRVAITSGNDSEVPDESVFMKYLIKALSETKDKYFTAQKMFITQILEAVMTETKTEPRYGTLELAGHVGGDFIFVKK